MPVAVLLGRSSLGDALINHLLIWIQRLPPLVVVMLMCLLLIVLGCSLDIASIIFLTTPLLLPMIKALGFDPIWYGVILVITCEMAFITPPMGMNLYVIKCIAPDVSIGEIIKGSLPFVIIDAMAIGIITAFPSLATWLPNLMISMS